MMQGDRRREGLGVCRAAWLIGSASVSIGRSKPATASRAPGTYERISELYGWPQTFVGQVRIG